MRNSIELRAYITGNARYPNKYLNDKLDNVTAQSSQLKNALQLLPTDRAVSLLASAYGFIHYTSTYSFLGAGRRADIVGGNIRDIQEFPSIFNGLIDYQNNSEQGEREQGFRIALLRSLGLYSPTQQEVMPSVADLSIEVSSIGICGEFEGKHRMEKVTELPRHPQQGHDTGIVLTVNQVPIFVAKFLGANVAVAVTNARAANGREIVEGGIYVLEESFIEKMEKVFKQGKRVLELQGGVGFTRLTSKEVTAKARQYVEEYPMRGPLPQRPNGMTREAYVQKNGGDEHARQRDGLFMS